MTEKRHRPQHADDTRRGGHSTDVPRRKIEWSLLAALAVAAVALGTGGFLRAEGGGLTFPRVLDAIYRSVQLFVLEMDGTVPRPLPWQLELARFLAPATGVTAGLKAILSLFRGQLQRLRVRRFRGHVVVAGAGERGAHLAEAFRDRGARVVVIEADGRNAQLARFDRRGIPAMIGDATRADVLRDAGAARSSHLIATLGDDAANAEVSVRLRELAHDSARPPTCLIEIRDPDLWRHLREVESAVVREPSSVRTEFFNLDEAAARLMLLRHPPHATPAPRANPPVILVGLGGLGRSLLVRAARDWRLARHDDALRLTVLAMDLRAEEICGRLIERHPELGSTLELVPRSIDVRSPVLERSEGLSGGDGMASPGIAYVTLGDEPLAASAALALQRAARGRGWGFPIVTRVREALGLARLLEGHHMNGAAAPIRSFAVLEHVCTPELLADGVTETIARALHATYVASETARGVRPDENAALVDWDDLSETHREHNRSQADALGRMLRERGYRVVPLADWDAWRRVIPPDAVEPLARAEHERWAATMRRSGYRWGAVKDLRAKTHPDLRTWEELEETDREKDRVFVRSWPRVLFLAGFEIDGLPRFETG